MFSAVIFGGMSVLSFWSITNIYLWRKNKSQKASLKYYFWQMNGLWNIINLIIAIVASIIVGINTANFNTNDSLQSLQIKIIATNILLDLIYVTIGLILEIRGKKNTNLRLRGYGESIQLQGAFLFCFDSMLALGLIVTVI